LKKSGHYDTRTPVCQECNLWYCGSCDNNNRKLVKMGALEQHLRMTGHVTVD
jgi:hypothetical protein